MNFTAYVEEHLHLHPSTQPRDVIKQCYQAARGAEHLLMDTARARAYFGYPRVFFKKLFPCGRIDEVFKKHIFFF